jgi:hypothetical protein
MTIFFIVPLRSSCSTKNWPRVCALFERTLRSICNQTDNNFKVIVVCNEIPNIGFSSPNMKYIQVDFSVAELESTNKQFLKLKRELDKARRMWVGLNTVESLQHSSTPTYVMFVDADDCITSKLAKFINSQAEACNGWYVNSGYEYPDGGKIVYSRMKNLCDKTNTSHVVRYDLLTPFAKLKFEDVDPDFLFHQNVRSIMDELGSPLQALPFPGVTYVTDNGENMYMQRDKIFQYNFDYIQLIRILGGSVRRLLIQKPLSESVCREFGIYQLDDFPSVKIVEV